MENNLFDEFDETRRLSLDELHKRAYESIDKFDNFNYGEFEDMPNKHEDNFNYDYEDPPPKKQEINANLMLKLKSIKSRY